MKVKCKVCGRTNTKLLFSPYLYLCKICDKVFSTKSVIVRIDSKDINVVLERNSPDIPIAQIDIKIGRIGVPLAQVRNRILDNTGLTDFRKNSVIKDLGIKLG